MQPTLVDVHFLCSRDLQSFVHRKKCLWEDSGLWRLVEEGSKLSRCLLSLTQSLLTLQHLGLAHALWEL